MSADWILLQLLVLLSSLLYPSLCEVAVNYVKPTQPLNATCPGQPCYTLEDYLHNSTRYFLSNATFEFLSGYHSVCCSFDVHGIEKLTFAPYLVGTTVIITSVTASPLTQPTVTLKFQSVSEISIMDMMFHQLGIAFDNCTDISLIDLNTGSNLASAIAMTNVYGSVNISQFKHRVSGQAGYSIDMNWSVAHPPFSTSTHVALQGINITGYDMKGMGVGISGRLPGDVLLKDSTFSGLGLAFSSNLSVVCNSPPISHEGLGRNIFSPTLRLHNVSYENNMKAVAFDGTCNATITDCLFEGMEDGAVSAVNSVIIVDGSTVFTGNTGYCGGVINLYQNNTLTLQDFTTLTDNFAHFGGAVCMNENNTISLKDKVSLSNNSALFSGGAIYVLLKNTITLRGNASLAGNSANDGGAVYLIRNNIITIGGFVELAYNNAQSVGGGIFAFQNNTITLRCNALLAGNSAYGGGAVYLHRNNAITIKGFVEFVNNNAQSAGGGGIIAFQNNAITLRGNASLAGNCAYLGGAVFLIHNNDITIGGFVELANNNGKFIGGGIAAYQKNTISLRGNVVLTGNNAGNGGGAIYSKDGNTITIQGSVKFVDNNAHIYGGAIGLLKDTNITIMGNVTFRANKAFTGGGIFVGRENSIIVKDGVTLTDNAANEAGGAVYVSSQNYIALFGNVSFRHNTAAKGGAIALVDSYIDLPLITEAHVLFENNTAQEVGGALFFSGFDQFLVTQCSLNLLPLNMTAHTPEAFIFIENTAAMSGDVMYGAYLEFRCYENRNRSGQEVLTRDLSKVIRTVSFFSPSFIDDFSLISSDPLAVRFCNKDRMPICVFNTTFNISVCPGQLFQVPVVTVGDMCGVVSAPVLATVERQCSGKLGNELQYKQTTNRKECSNLQYSIFTNLTSNECVLTLSLIGSVNINFVNSTIQINALVLGCPKGFTLNGSYCDCNVQLKLAGAVCNITEKSIIRRGTAWIGVSDNGSSLVFSPICPLDYCKNVEVKLLVNQNLIDEDSQCTANRSGILCGHCKDNFSLVLGSDRCLPNCNYNSLSLIIAFVIAGIILVFFIKILNFTVSQGSPNGLIFYANIIGASQPFVFTNCEIRLVDFLATFIAWVNLDLGIETCFLYGMDGTTKAWLQFLFPVYIWAIAFFIIVLSHYSVRASRLFGNNSVHVLATLILLSYSKMLRAIISALSVAQIQYLDGSKILVWERDGNIQYLTGEHIPLFSIALVVLVLLLFPFTLILFSVQWLQRGTQFRALHWVTKLMPFFDAFTGPLKYQHRYWVGLLLFVRCILLLVFSTTTGHKFTASLSSIVIAVFVLLAISGSPYRNTYLTVLEKSYILNLGLLSTGTIYIRYSASSNQEALTITSVGIVFLQFVATVIYHCYVKLRDPVKRLVTKMREKEDVQVVTSYDGCSFEPFEVSDQQPLIQPSYQIIDGRPGRDKNGDPS